ncbi:kinase/pyrophosphorylase [Vibrio sp. JC009]|uniref:posphoenolpyruvate synthetase regulatory kinase/phosphorylase PpsR n=1 Tax=Vibrio sp. JC009 TaxID=2912314 RepID=UPI0023AE73E5|nr:pyruvate, water dikinase regulatory protein [Vibrio sp. JC009]WED22562.1 kinase/pyrophosphorylase [Vibrio sp. JC009]
MENLNQTRDVFYVSDGTAITCETLGHAVMPQFTFSPVERTYPFIESEEKLKELIREIERSNRERGCKPLVFFSMVIPELKEQLLQCGAFFYDVLQPLIDSMQRDLQMEAMPKLQRSRSVTKNSEGYFDRIAAVEYTLAHDDGVSLKDLDKADIILLGVSRSGKTPTSVYLAMQFGLRVVNYPFIEEDLQRLKLLPELEVCRHKLFGLTIDPHRLAEVRGHRLAQSNYASLEQCTNEIEHIQAFFRREAVPYIDTSELSVEEISARILEHTGIQRNLY